MILILFILITLLLSLVQKMYLQMPQNQQIARVYEQMQKGDKKARQRLMGIQNARSQKLKKPQQYKDEQINVQLPKSQPILKNNHKKFSKNKSNIGINLPSLKKDTRNPENYKSQNKGYEESKPFSRSKNRNQEVVSEEKNEIKGKKRNAPKVKTTSNNFQKKMQNNIIKETKTSPQNQKLSNSKISTPDNYLGRNRPKPAQIKQLYDDLLNLNEEQRTLQLDIMITHNETKDDLEASLKKYKLKQKDDAQEANEILDDKEIVTLSCLSKIVKKSNRIEEEEKNIAYYHKSLKQLNHSLAKKKKEIQKKKQKAQESPLIPYLQQFGNISEKDEKEEVESEESISKIDNSSSNRLPIIHTKTYRNMMFEMRKKKWSLNKRLNYEYQLENNESHASISNSKKEIKPIPQIIEYNRQNGDNKVVVNSRLKQFLFD